MNVKIPVLDDSGNVVMPGIHYFVNSDEIEAALFPSGSTNIFNDIFANRYRGRASNSNVYLSPVADAINAIAHSFDTDHFLDKANQSLLTLFNNGDLTYQFGWDLLSIFDQNAGTLSFQMPLEQVPAIPGIKLASQLSVFLCYDGTDIGGATNDLIYGRGTPQAPSTGLDGFAITTRDSTSAFKQAVQFGFTGVDNDTTMSVTCRIAGVETTLRVVRDPVAPFGLSAPP